MQNGLIGQRRWRYREHMRAGCMGRVLQITLKTRNIRCEASLGHRAGVIRCGLIKNVADGGAKSTVVWADSVKIIVRVFVSIIRPRTLVDSRMLVCRLHKKRH